ncbi:reverse transcriptase [Tanacetum coccineum]|uniref:Reverse transcriptase n=1 Tax=Tanacetum coccineum TaxID=301880 RepID=A0ABQ5F0Q0_9ASTR
MVGTRNSGMEVHVDETTRNWVTNHVNSIVMPLNEKIDNLTNSVNQLLLQQQYVNRGEGSNKFSRLGKMEFPKFHVYFTWTEYKEAVLKRFGDANTYPTKNTTLYQHQILRQNNSVFGSRLRKMLSQKEYDEKRAKNQCFYCDQKYMPGHKCEGQMFTIEIRGKEEEVFEDCLGEEGSTHNFLDLHKAKKLGCKIRRTCPVNVYVAVAGGNKLISQYMVKNFQWKWKIQGVLFTTDVMLLPLGVRKVILKGTNHSELTWMSGKAFSKQVNQQDAYLTSICCMSPSATLHLMQGGDNHELTQNRELQTLLEEYANVFEEPKTLPPHRSFVHQIPLKEGDVNVNIRPYRYPLSTCSQKDVIETMVKELLDSRVIKPSHRPFSSSIVMVKKKDGSWRMCIDYRQLNKFTVKDKFPIPIIEELIDELQGAQLFSKLDLRSGCHQIRMKVTMIRSSISEHITHLRMVLQVMRMNTLFIKKSKCVFGTDTVAYLGHVINGGGVETGPRYYRRFIKGYAVISQPLTTLLKKNAFQSNSQTQVAFEKLKQAMVNSPVLALPNFEEEFVIETDASGVGKDNVVIDALSRIERAAKLFSLLSSGLSNDLMDGVISTWTSDDNLKKTVEGMQNKTLTATKYEWVNGQLLRTGKWVVGKDETLRTRLIAHFHGSAVGGHLDILSKQAHFLPLAHPYNASQVAQLFLDHIYKLHGLPKSIVSDRDKIFMSLFWKSLFEKLQVQLKMSSAYHPKLMDRHKCQSNVEAVDRTLQARENTIQLLKFNLKTQDRMKSDKKRTEREFKEGDWVYLKLQPYRPLTLRQGRQNKFSSKFYGPFQVIKKVGAMGQFPQCDAEGLIGATPFKLLERRIAKQGNRVVVFGLIQWSNVNEEDATWESLSDIVKTRGSLILFLILEDKEAFKEDGLSRAQLKLPKTDS